MTTHAEKALTLARLHAAPEILRLVNVWDAVSTRTIAALPETRAIATAGHSIAATFGYRDGTIPSTSPSTCSAASSRPPATCR
jgi:2-methylisocitrate lyase-like PEP mutase family enzyme